MIVYSRDLPSGGYLGGGTSYELNPLTYRELMNLLAAPEVTEFRSYIKDLKLLIKMEPRAAMAPMIDADYLIYLMKMVTISEERKFSTSIVCPHCNASFNTEYSTKNIGVKDIESVIESVQFKSGKVKVTMPTIEQLIVFADRLPPYGGKEWTIDDLKLYSLFYDHVNTPPVGMVLNLVDNAIHEDISTIYAIKDFMINGISDIELTCPECKRGIVIGALASVADLFRLVLQHNEFDTNKIHIREIRPIE